MPTATGSFDVDLQPREPSNNNSHISRMSINKTFSGDLEATSIGEMLAVTGSVEASAGYVAMERVSGTLSGRSGSFALQHLGIMSRGEGSLRVVVVPDSGTGELAALAGEMTIDVTDDGHRYSFEYSLE